MSESVTPIIAGVRLGATVRVRLRVRVLQPELTVVVAAVVGVRDHVDALLAGALGHHEVGAACRRRQHEGDAGETQWCRHGGHVRMLRLRRARDDHETCTGLWLIRGDR